MKISFLPIVSWLLKSLFTVKKIFLMITLFAAGYCIKKKFFHKLKVEKNSQSIIATRQEPLPTQLKVELFCFFQKRCKLPDDLINKIFFISESAIARKNLLFLSFYQDGFIDLGNRGVYESNPPHFPYCKEIVLNSHVTAIFWPANPFIQASKDHIILEEREKILTIQHQQENAYVNQIYQEIIKIIPHFEYRTLQECKAINQIFYTVQACTTIDQIKHASRHLLSIQSEKLRLMLFEQLQIAAYQLWFKLQWNETDTMIQAVQTEKILIHPHFFYWQMTYDEKSILTHEEFSNLFASKKHFITAGKTPLQETAHHLVVHSDYSHKYVQYPHPFIIIGRDKPLKMH